MDVLTFDTLTFDMVITMAVIKQINGKIELHERIGKLGAAIKCLKEC